MSEKKSGGFTDAERAAELKKEARGGSSAKKRADGERDVLAKIAEMEGTDREMAEGVHSIVEAVAPDLVPRTWYGMPAYSKEGKVLCFFQSAQKAEERYASLGFTDVANLDDGPMWPTVYALGEWNAAVKERIEALLKRAAG